MKYGKFIFFNLFLFAVDTCAYCDDTLFVVSGNIPTSGTYSDVRITDGGDYALSLLDNILASNANVNVDFNYNHGTTTSGIARLIADSNFDGVLDARIQINSNSCIVLTDEYLAAHSGAGEILRISEIGGSQYPSIREENVSGVYSYSFEQCAGSNGKCLTRTVSGAYVQGIQNQQQEILVATTGVQNNPDLLLQPMSEINHNELLRYYDFSDEIFMSVAPEYHASKDFHNVGLHLNSGGIVIGRLSVGVGAYMFKGNFANSVSDFRADIYGGNLRLKYKLDDSWFLRGIAGVSFADTDCDSVVDGNGGVVNNPGALGVYGGVDFGTVFNYESGLFVSPFIGVNAIHESVVDVKNNNLFVRAGSDIGFKYFMDGVSYGYVLRMGLNSDGYFDADVGINVWTVADKIGAAVSVGVMDTDYGLTGKISGDIKVAF